jgi:hypothetical protein
MSTSTFIGTGDGWVGLDAPAYLGFNLVHNDSSGGNIRSSGRINTRTSLAGGSYYIRRSFAKFDTSSIPDNEIISSVTLYLTVDGKVGTGQDIHCVTTTLTEMDSLSDYVQTKFGTTSLGSISGDFSVNATCAMGLNVSINKSGFTCLGFRSYYDIVDQAPTNENYYTFYSSTTATQESYKPTLVVEHYTPPLFIIGG